jgi:hypothetical protein
MTILETADSAEHSPTPKSNTYYCVVETAMRIWELWGRGVGGGRLQSWHA